MKNGKKVSFDMEWMKMRMFFTTYIVTLFADSRFSFYLSAVIVTIKKYSSLYDKSKPEK